MSVIVADLLKLPSLREAKLLAGSSALERTVSSISVLEYAEPTVLQDALFKHNQFEGNEIVITGFINIKDNVEAQCATIQRLADVGEVGLILYYIGIFMPEVDRKVIELAERLGFALICMPPNRMDLRYSDVICETMEAIFKEQNKGVYYVGEFLDEIALLPEELRSMDTVLRMLRDRIRASFILTDNSAQILNLASWPRDHEQETRRAFSSGKKPGDDSWWIQRFPIVAAQGPTMYLYALRENGIPVDEDTLRQACDVVHLFVNIWSRRHGEFVVSELVRAILKDESIKMRRLAKMFNIDVGSMNAMWAFHPIEHGERKLHELLPQIRSRMDRYFSPLVIDSYEGFVVAFMNDTEQLHALDAIAVEAMESWNDVYLVQAHNLITTADAREAFLTVEQSLEVATAIYVDRRILSLQQIRFADRCRQIISLGEQEIERHTQVLSPLNTEEPHQRQEMLRTLTVFLLDAQCNVARTAILLNVHKNTVKYRMQRLNDRFGYDVGDFPGTIALYTAVALQRLLGNSK